MPRKITPKLDDDGDESDQKAITHTAITALTEAAKAAGKMLVLADKEGRGRERGLRIRAYSTGRRVWYLQMRDSLTKVNNYPLGEYPHLGLKEAREAARATRHKVRHEQADPVAERRERRQAGKNAQAGIGTFASVLDNYGKVRAPKSWPHSRKRVDRVFKDLLAKPAEVLKAKDFRIAADKFMPRESAHFAIRAVRPALKWAEDREYMPVGVGNLKAPQPKERDRSLSVAEMARVLGVLRPLEHPHHAALRMMMWTMTRLDETCQATWGEIDITAGTWALPWVHTKNGIPHRLHLPRQAVEVLAAIKPENPPADMLVFRTSNGTKLANWDRVTKAIHRDSKTKEWHRHDLRRTGATWLGEMGIMPDMVEAGLNHKVIRSRIAGIYNAARYAPAVGEALQMLADKQTEIEAWAEKAAKNGDTPAPTISVQGSLTQRRQPST